MFFISPNRLDPKTSWLLINVSIFSVARNPQPWTLPRTTTSAESLFSTFGRRVSWYWGRKYYSPGVKSSSCEECFSTDSDTTLLCRLVANVSDDNFQFLFCRNWNYSHPEKEPTGAKLFPCMCRRRAACSKMVPCSTCIHPPPSQNWRYAPLQWILKICTTDIPHWPCLYQPSPSFPLWQWSHHRACHDSILERFSRSMSGTEHLAVKQGVFFPKKLKYRKPMLVRWIYVDVDRPRYT